MTLVSMDKELAEELVDMKLERIQKYINRILTKWNYNSADKFIEDARQGKIAEAEEDAISLTNLLDKQVELVQMKHSWSLTSVTD